MAGNSRILTISILSDASKVRGGFSAAQKATNDFAKTLGIKSNTNGAKVGGALIAGIDSAVGKGMKVVGGGAAAVLGTALVKGFQRLTAIDDATAKLRGLGHSAGDVKLIMDNALASVKGTAFGLGEAATTAAQVVAAGIKPGKELEGVLKTVADAATIGGASMDEMGSIFGKVAAKNKLQADVINQMTDRGIPVLQMLAKHYGITAEAASDMVTDGKVDFKNFAAAMKQGVGGAALESGNTFKGAWANTLAALSRVGANLLQPIFDATKTGLKGLPELLAPLEAKAKAVGQIFADMLAWVQKNTGLLKNLGVAAGIAVGVLLTFRTIVGVMQAYQAVMAVVKAAQVAYTVASYGAAGASYAMVGATNAQRIAALAGAAAQWALNSAIFASPITWIIVGIVALVAAFVILWNKSAAFRNFWIGLWKSVQAAYQAVVAAFKTAWSAVWSWATSYVRAQINAAIAVVRTVQAIVAAVAAKIRAVWSAVWSWVTLYVRAQINVAIAVVRTVQAVVAAVGGAIRSAWSTVWSAVGKVAKSALDGILAPVNAIRSAFDKVVSAIKSVIDWISRIKIPDVLGKIGGLLGIGKKAAIAPATLTAGGVQPRSLLRAAPAVAAMTAAPSVRRLSLGTDGGGVVYNITVNGGLDSGDTIARRVKEALTGHDRRQAGTTLARRVA